MSEYVLQVGRRRLRLGTSSEPPQTSTAPSVANASWDLPRRALPAREIVESLDTLFEAVCLRLGPELDRAPLLQSMAATLAIAGREACLPLEALAFADPVRRELTSQAARIGRTLAAWAAEASSTRVALGQVGREKLETLETAQPLRRTSACGLGRRRRSSPGDAAAPLSCSSTTSGCIR